MAETSASHKFSREFEAYRFRNGYLVSISKNKVRGKGRTLQIRFSSSPGKDFQLLGWGIEVSKETQP